MKANIIDDFLYIIAETEDEENQLYKWRNTHYASWNQDPNSLDDFDIVSFEHKDTYIQEHENGRKLLNDIFNV